jgi:hypothetical protein
VEYPYFLAGITFVAVGLLAFSFIVLSALRRSFFGAGFAIPIVLGFFTIVYIPDGKPHIQKSMMSDSNYISSVNSFLPVWYESHRSFPRDEAEFRDAISSGPAAWQYRVAAPSSLSEYAKNGTRLPYEIVVVQNASGPRLENISERPGVIYYCITSDRQQFWATMSGLHEDVSRSASLARVADISAEKPRLAMGSGKDYPVQH